MRAAGSISQLAGANAAIEPGRQLLRKHGIAVLAGSPTTALGRVLGDQLVA